MHTKRQAQGERLVTIASQELPRVTEFQFGGELVVLQPVSDTKETFQVVLLCPRPPGPAGPVMGGAASIGSVSDALEKKCEMAFTEVETRPTSKLESWVGRTEKAYSAPREELQRSVEWMSREIDERLKVQALAHESQLSKAADRMSQMENAVGNLATSCETKFGAIEMSLQQQAKTIADTKSSYERKLEDFGGRLLEQIHTLQASAQPKRRMTEPVAENVVNVEDEAMGSFAQRSWSYLSASWVWRLTAICKYSCPGEG